MLYLKRVFQLGISTAPYRKQCQKFVSFPRGLDVFEHMRLFPVVVKTSCLALNGQKARPIAFFPLPHVMLYTTWTDYLVNVTFIFCTHSLAFRFGPRWRGLSKINEGKVKVFTWSVETLIPDFSGPAAAGQRSRTNPLLLWSRHNVLVGSGSTMWRFWQIPLTPACGN